MSLLAHCGTGNSFVSKVCLLYAFPDMNLHHAIRQFGIGGTMGCLVLDGVWIILKIRYHPIFGYCAPPVPLDRVGYPIWTNPDVRIWGLACNA